MRMACLRAGAAAVTALLLLGCASDERRFEPRRDVPFERVEWKFGQQAGARVLTEHYDVRTTVRDEGMLEALPQALETFYAYFRFLMPNAPEVEERMAIYLFAQRGEFEAYTQRLGAERAELLLKVRYGGYTESGVAVIEYINRPATYTLMAHEALHQYLDRAIGGRVPAWLNEGLAVMAECHRWGAVGVRDFDPWFNPRRRDDLIQATMRGDLFPLPELLRINAGHVVGGSARRTSAYYAQLWGLMVFLQHGEQGKYAAGFQNLLNTIGEGDLDRHARAVFVASRGEDYDFGEALFRAFISDDLDEVAAEFHEFVSTEVIGRP
jgi:hypothetical protein